MLTDLITATIVYAGEIPDVHPVAPPIPTGWKIGLVVVFRIIVAASASASATVAGLGLLSLRRGYGNRGGAPLVLGVIVALIAVVLLVGVFVSWPLPWA
ncbi:hypothetical protein ALI44B_00880 [Leifsonia sp. ALI-44-B]|uniref:hypothetical protein n=1 Tax=Leifsonia sp. ALI-44-B TaxID=1933776 RepID=UPI00097CBF5A|nr:hypothetical protein [Leifsonia sp. ALI-44-B]ONI65280.1 hypothetical protein ALI44B_00880 [Leifsonia sp. ALI-44-B]